MLKNARRRAATRAKVRRKAKEAKGIKVRDTRDTRREEPKEEDTKEADTKEEDTKEEDTRKERGRELITGVRQDTKEDGRGQALKEDSFRSPSGTATPAEGVAT